MTDMRGITSSTGQVVVKDFMQLIYLELRCIIEWAKKVPGLCQLCFYLTCLLTSDSCNTCHMPPCRIAVHLVNLGLPVLLRFLLIPDLEKKAAVGISFREWRLDAVSVTVSNH